MSAFRKLVLAASIVALGLSGGLAQAEHSNNSSSSRFVDSCHDDYCVYYKDCGRWKLFGCFGSYSKAWKAAKSLKCQGFRTYIAS